MAKERRSWRRRKYNHPTPSSLSRLHKAVSAKIGPAKRSGNEALARELIGVCKLIRAANREAA